MEQRTLSGFGRALQKARTVGIDSPCFIYQLARHKKYLFLSDELFSLLSKGTITAITSTITVVETFTLPERLNQTILISEYERIFHFFPHLRIDSIGWSHAKLAAKLRGKYPALRTPDALQLAAALLAQCQLFVTNDRRLKQVKEIKVVVLDEFI